MLDYVVIRDGSAKYEIRTAAVDEIRTAAVDEWPMASWKACMKHMARGGWLNNGTAEELASWFPEAIKAASEDLKEAQTAFSTSYRPLKEIPKEDREKQKYLNLALHTSVREARAKQEKLKARYLEFLAAKADLKKEN